MEKRKAEDGSRQKGRSIEKRQQQAEQKSTEKRGPQIAGLRKDVKNRRGRRTSMNTEEGFASHNIIENGMTSSGQQ